MSAEFSEAFAKVLIAILTAISTLLGNIGVVGPISQPCQEPIAYSIGVFDRRFNISHADFEKSILEAEAIWEKALGKELFIYAPEKSSLTVNLIYDYRQEVTSTLNKIENVVEQNEATYNALRAKYLSSKSEYEGMKSAYDSRVDQFDSRNAEYEKAVQSWNSGPRTNETEFASLERMRSELQAAAKMLKTLEAELNIKVREVNTQVSELNELAKTLNINAETYNTIGASRGETFTGGLYHSDGKTRAIDIFEFENHTKLVRTLAHELGHALNLDHLNDPKAIMYYLNEGSIGTLSTSDIAALKQLCGVK